MVFDLPLDTPRSRADLRSPVYRRSWTRGDVIESLSPPPIRVLDIGAGRHPICLRDQDEIVTVDFDDTSNPTCVADLSAEWPFRSDEFDFIYMAHVVEHFYPQDRDRLLCHVHQTVRPGGFVLIRVPHRSSIQATGWEHHTLYGTNGATSLCHGFNPMLPMFRSVSTGLALSVDFGRDRGPIVRASEWLLNRSFRLTDQLLAKAIGGVAEVQFLLQRLPVVTEERLRADTTTGAVN